MGKFEAKFVSLVDRGKEEGATYNLVSAICLRGDTGQEESTTNSRSGLAEGKEKAGRQCSRTFLSVRLSESHRLCTDRDRHSDTATQSQPQANAQRLAYFPFPSTLFVLRRFAEKVNT